MRPRNVNFLGPCLLHESLSAGWIYMLNPGSDAELLRLIGENLDKSSEERENRRNQWGFTNVMGRPTYS